MSDLGIFGGNRWYKQIRSDFYAIAEVLFTFPPHREYEKLFLLAIVRRTLSLELSFRQSIESRNGQMAATLIRLHLDTVARLYTLFWAEETKGMCAESLSRDVANGKEIRKMRLRGSKDQATDSWLIKQIEPLASWIPKVYKTTSGAIHFSDFHVKQLMGQFKSKGRLEGGGLLAELTLGPTDRDANPEHYLEVRQAFLHISMLMTVALRDRCELACGEQDWSARPDIHNDDTRD
ncbi:hypothetical protein V2I59_00335 [Pseudomonas viridiflava]|uniref:hypothetical protein n=1 Tax=Pseudomonas viridiflava TaxID=33069 RepID=UPI000F02C62D|nr:hypothetical protein [Pseudomonas viridiflava]MEE4091972.1 hypothetical protein [Pseudomonas viridiflava]